MPSSASMNSSGDRTDRARSAAGGTARASVSAPNTDPASELKRDAPIARAASPRRAIGWPSTIVAAAVASPGMPTRIDVRSPVVAATEATPMRRAKASCGFEAESERQEQCKMAAPPRPGRMPTSAPIRTPTTRNPITGHANT